MSKYLVTLPKGFNEFGEDLQGPAPTDEIIGKSAIVTYSGCLIIKDKRGLVRAYADDKWTEVERLHEQDEIPGESEPQDKEEQEEEMDDGNPQ